MRSTDPNLAAQLFMLLHLIYNKSTCIYVYQAVDCVGGKVKEFPFI